jgi:hypothetical protein
MAKAAAKAKVLAWPRGLRETPQRLWWFQHFAALPPRLPLADIANQLGINYSLARYYARMFKYRLGELTESERVGRRRRRQSAPA